MLQSQTHTPPNEQGQFPTDFKTFKEFYPYYLGEHRTRACKTLHFIGATFFIATVIWMFATGYWQMVWILPLVGYGFAWIGHFGFEKNKPASFKWPAYSIRGDFVMWWHLLSGKLGFADNAPLKL